MWGVRRTPLAGRGEARHSRAAGLALAGDTNCDALKRWAGELKTVEWRARSSLAVRRGLYSPSSEPTVVAVVGFVGFIGRNRYKNQRRICAGRRSRSL